MKSPSVTSKETVSHWEKKPFSVKLPKLEANLEVDVCIIGAGIAGLTTAYLLAKEGKSVAVLESGAPGCGQTGRTTAHFVNALDDRYFELEKLHGAEGARLAAESHTAAITRVEEIIRAEKIDCGWQRVPGYLYCSPQEDVDYLKKEFAAIKRAGLTGVEMVESSPVKSFETGPCLAFPRQGQLHILRYLEGLTKAILRDGGQVFVDTQVDTIQKEGEKLQVLTHRHHKVTAKNLIVATNTPINDMVVIHTKQAPYRTYVIAAEVPKGSVPKLLLWDTGDPYHYIRIEEGEKCDYLIVGGEDHKTGQESDTELHFRDLEAWTKTHFEIGEITSRWSGQVQEPVDGLGFLGRNPLDGDNVYVITGDSGNGMTHGTIGALIITDQLAKRKNPWEELYRPSRRSIRALGKYLEENANVVCQLKDFVTPGEVKDASEIKPGEGAIMREGTSIIAAYVDEKKKVHKLSAVCPHLGCIVHWNSSEKSWDCPCHGSRFAQDGAMLTGPAASDLKKVE